MEPTQIAIGKPTHVRWQILAMLTLIMAVTALGRLNLSIAGKYIQDEFGFGNHAMGWILGAFAFGYALFQVPCGSAGWVPAASSPHCCFPRWCATGAGAAPFRCAAAWRW